MSLLVLRCFNIIFRSSESSYYNFVYQCLIKNLIVMEQTLEIFQFKLEVVLYY